METSYNEIIRVQLRDETAQGLQAMQARLQRAEQQLARFTGKQWSVRLGAVDKMTAMVRSAMSAAGRMAQAGITIPIKAVTAAGGLLGGLGLAGMGVQSLAGAAQGAAQAMGFGLAVEMENTGARMMAFTKDAGATANILQTIKDRAAATPFSFSEMSNAAASLLPVTKSAGMGLEDLMKTAEILAASNPMQGLEGASFSLREALSGDFVSIQDRFNLSRTTINKWKDAGLSNFEIVQKAMADMGMDASLVSNLAGTLTGRWSTFQDTIADVQRILVQPLFDRVSAGLVDAQKFLEANQETLKQWGITIGNTIGNALDTIGRFGQIVGAVFTAFTVDAGAMGIAMAEVRAIFGDTLADAVEPFFNAFMQAIPSIQALWEMFRTGDFKGGIFDWEEDHPFLLFMFDLQGLVPRIQAAFEDLKPTFEIIGGAISVMGAGLAILVPHVTNFITGLSGVQEQSTATQDPLKTVTDTINTMAAALQNAKLWLDENKWAQAALVGALTAVTAAIIVQNVIRGVQFAIMVAQAAPFALWIAQMWLAVAAQTALNVVMALNPFAIVAIALVALAGALIYAYNTSEEFRAVVEPIFEWLGTIGNWLLNNALKPAFEGIMRIFQEFAEKGPAALLLLPARFMELGLEIMNALIKGFGGPDVLGWLRTNIFDKIGEMIRGIPGQLQTAVSGAFGGSTAPAAVAAPIGTDVFDNGGILPPGATLAMNRTGKPEAVLTGRQLASMGGPTVVVEQGAVQINLGPGSNAEDVARAAEEQEERLWLNLSEKLAREWGNMVG